LRLATHTHTATSQAVKVASSNTHTLVPGAEGHASSPDAVYRVTIGGVGALPEGSRRDTGEGAGVSVTP